MIKITWFSCDWRYHFYSDLDLTLKLAMVSAAIHSDHQNIYEKKKIWALIRIQLKIEAETIDVAFRCSIQIPIKLFFHIFYKINKSECKNENNSNNKIYFA